MIDLPPYPQASSDTTAVAARDHLLRLVAQEIEGAVAAVLLQIEDAMTLVAQGQTDLLQRLRLCLLFLTRLQNRGEEEDRRKVSLWWT